MGKWLRIDVNVDEHPKMLAAGPWGAMVTMAAWRAAKLFDQSDGDVTKLWNSRYLARRLQLDTCRDVDGIALVEQGMEAAERAGLLERTEDGRVLVHDWADYQRDTTAAARKRRQRARSKHETVTRDTVTSRVTGRDTVTSRCDGTGRDGTKQDRGGARASDPSGMDPLCQLYTAVATRHRQLLSKEGYRVGGTAAQWAAEYVQALSTPPGSAAPPPPEYDTEHEYHSEMARRVGVVLDFFETPEGRELTWSDGTPWLSHLRGPTALVRRMNDRDLLEAVLGPDEPEIELRVGPRERPPSPPPPELPPLPPDAPGPWADADAGANEE